MPNSIDWDALIPGCQNFYWREVVTTTHDSEKLKAELMALPEKEFEAVRDNIISIANILQVARNMFGPIKIASWYRSKRIEKLVGGSGANHRTGGAVDPVLSALQYPKFVQLFNATWHGGLGFGNGQAHIDNGAGHAPGKRRWKY